MLYEIIRFLHPKIIGDFLNNVEKSRYVCLSEVTWLMATKMRLKIKSRYHKYDINKPRCRHDTNIVNVKNASVWWCVYVLNSAQAICEVQFMKKISNTEAEKPVF